MAHREPDQLGNLTYYPGTRHPIRTETRTDGGRMVFSEPRRLALPAPTTRGGTT